jgi:hypothetical protein
MSYLKLMSKLANHIVVLCSHDNTGCLVKCIDAVLGLDQNQFSPQDWIKINSSPFM